MLSSCNESVADSITLILLSQDGLLLIAIEKYIQRRKNQKLLHSINNAYADGLDASEKTMLNQIRRHQQQLFEQEYLK
ncbi:hypothetical protein DSM106972_046610 [Dulcicalothrix desertica PCC 7102]|uniref:Uncharacterized protein n=2 Tax=Dulcicalothrix desertica TaxID=32056 RepID=A0A433VED4_9CYAN|nr:hypothetical protein [Dulcicalothrix desertica]RUT04433.1 hypothetical protein DSM106972_046610 [Dulcicalothrix desertica PCC 7102]TWH51283.1 hypothetical protein CAL7102_05683 [Dulcicalothrix desertica PCC 7102]